VLLLELNINVVLLFILTIAFLFLK